MITTCRQCGCTEDDACIVDGRIDGQHDGCHWVEPDLCSACAFPETRVRGPLLGAGRLQRAEVVERLA